MNEKLIIILAAVLLAGGILLKTQSSSATKKATQADSAAVTSQIYTLSQVSAHSVGSDCWMTIDGKVYNVTEYVPAHPNTQIVDGCGKDATQMFNNVPKHMGRATNILSGYLIGTLSN